ncbi:hypothetical protein [Spiroplasma alleghenense]|uniref:Lipoprotein n=1 Tax=Spiroplasma alleghenense TaxID=216931 RepID=A0A345Z3D4_9MOLU|nr:hypothetical protein [Spiroplasma alleghenense]AXK51113.1 hypothetical protein SALLE_v1c04390 [Spiroplasma alleghenense]
MRKLTLILASSTFLFASGASTISCYYNPNDKMTDAEKIASIKNISDKDIEIADYDFPTYFSAELQRQLDDNFSEFFSDQKIDEKTQVALTTNISTGIIANEAFSQLAKKNKKFSWMFSKTREQGNRFSFNNFKVENVQNSINSMFVNENDWITNVTFMDEELKPWLLSPEIFVPEDEVVEENFDSNEINKSLIDDENNDENNDENELFYYNVDLSKLENYPKFIRFNVLGKIAYDDYGNVIIEESNPAAIVYDKSGIPVKRGETTFVDDFGPVAQGTITSSKALRIADKSFEDNNYYSISASTLDYTISIFDFWNNVSYFEESL